MPHVPWRNILGKTEEGLFANNKTDAKNIGFDDSFIYDELALPRDGRKLSSEEMMRNEAIKAFEMWAQKDDKIEY